MERFELQGLLVDIRTTFLQRQGIIQLRVEGQHVQLHRLAIHFLLGVHHVLDKLGITRSRWMDPHHHLRLLWLLLIRTFRTHLFAIGVDRLFADLISSHDGRCQQLKQSRRETLTTGRVTDDERRVVQASQLLWAMIEPVGAACHQGHQQPTSHKQRRRILILLQSLRDIPDNWVILTQRLNLRTPFPEPSADVCFTGDYRLLRLRLRDFHMSIAFEGKELAYFRSF